MMKLTPNCQWNYIDLCSVEQSEMAFQKQLLLPLWQCLQLQSVLLCCLILFLQSCLVPVWGRGHAHTPHAHTHHSHTTTPHTPPHTHHTRDHNANKPCHIPLLHVRMCSFPWWHLQPAKVRILHAERDRNQTCREEQNRTHDDSWLEGILQYSSKKGKDQSSINHVRKQLGKIGNELGINPKIPTL